MGILNPLALAYLPVVGLLVLIYLFRKKRKTIPVPSFIPWRGMRQDTVRSKAFLADILFFLQLIALLLLVFFLTRPYLPSFTSGVIGRDIIVLLDTSASMQTQEGERTRFQMAQEQVLELVDGMGIGDSMQIITIHTRPHILNDFSSNKEGLRELVRGLKSVDSGTNLDEGLSLTVSLLGHTGRGELHVFTDTERPGGMGSNVRFVNLAESSRDNLAITGLDIYQDMFKEYREREAYVTVENFSENPKTVLIKSYLNRLPLEEQVTELLPGEEKTIRIRGIRGPGLLKVELEPGDALGVDNSAYAIIKHKKTLRALVVAEERLFVEELRRIENATQQVEFTVIQPGSYGPGETKDYDMVIFHQYVPTELPDKNALFIFPDKDNTAFPVVDWVRGASFIDWDSSSPIMKHLDYMDDIWIYKALYLVPDKGLEPLIMAAGTEEDFPVALAGTTEGKKVVVLGFDVADFNLSKAKNVPILIMLLNIIQWLNPYGAETYQIMTGEPFVVDLEDRGGEREVTLVTPDGKTLSLNTAENPLRVTDTYLKGEYVLKDGEDETRFVANLFDVKESDIRTIISYQEGEDFEEAVASTYVKEKQLDLGRYILAFVALLLLAEWIFYCLRARTRVA